MKNWLFECFYIPKNEKMSERVFMHNIALAVFIIIMCLSSMTLTAYAYFTASVTSSFQTIQSAEYDCVISVRKTDGTEAVFVDGSLPAGEYAVDITKVVGEKSASTGFCVVWIGQQQFHTQQIGKDGDSDTPSISFVLRLGEAQQIRFVPHWGTSSHYAGYNRGEQFEYYITDDEVLTIGAFDAVGIDDEEEATEPTEPATEPETEPATEAETEPATEVSTEPAAEVPAEPVTEPETEPVTEPETEPATEPETEPATEQDTEAPSETTPESEQPPEVTETP